MLGACPGGVTASYTYTTDDYLIDPFSLKNNRISSITLGTIGDVSSADESGGVAGTYSYTWGPTLMGYNHWGIDAHTNTFTDARGSLYTTLFGLSGEVYGPVNSLLTRGPSYSGAAASS